jgi:dUTP pyrophosphatase
MKIKIVRIEKDLPLPEYKTAGAVAFDVYTRVAETIQPGERKVLPSNLIIEVPEGHGLILASRSSTGKKKGLLMPNGIGVLDQDFHGPQDEMGILVYNFIDQPVSVERGERIAQAFIIPILKVEFDEVEQIKEDSRGGFGSTG